MRRRVAIVKQGFFRKREYSGRFVANDNMCRLERFQRAMSGVDSAGPVLLVTHASSRLVHEVRGRGEGTGGGGSVIGSTISGFDALMDISWYSRRVFGNGGAIALTGGD